VNNWEWDQISYKESIRSWSRLTAALVVLERSHFQLRDVEIKLTIRKCTRSILREMLYLSAGRRAVLGDWLMAVEGVDGL